MIYSYVFSIGELFEEIFKNVRLNVLAPLCVVNKCFYVGIRNGKFLKMNLKEHFEYSEEELKINDALFEATGSELWTNMKLFVETAPAVEMKDFFCRVVPNLGAIVRWTSEEKYSTAKFKTNGSRLRLTIKPYNYEVNIKPGHAIVQMRIIEQLQRVIKDFRNLSDDSIARILCLMIRFIRGDYENMDYQILVDLIKNPEFEKWKAENDINEETFDLCYPIHYLSKIKNVQTYGVYKELLIYWFQNSQRICEIIKKLPKIGRLPHYNPMDILAVDEKILTKCFNLSKSKFWKVIQSNHYSMNPVFITIKPEFKELDESLDMNLLLQIENDIDRELFYPNVEFEKIKKINHKHQNCFMSINTPTSQFWWDHQPAMLRLYQYEGRDLYDEVQEFTQLIKEQQELHKLNCSNKRTLEETKEPKKTTKKKKFF